MAECVDCGEEYPQARYELGYLQCLGCGNKEALTVKQKLDNRNMPAYNKGAYMVIGTGDEKRQRQNVLGMTGKGVM